MSLLAVSAGAARASRKQPVFAFSALVALILVLQFSPIAGLIGFRLTGDGAWSLIGVARDALVLTLAAGVLVQSMFSVRPSRWRRSTAWATATLLAVGGLATVSSADVASIALNLRRLLLFPLLSLAVIWAQLSPKQVALLLRLILGTTLIVAVFGILEYFAPDALWSDYFKVVNYFSSNPFDPFGALPFRESGRFFTWDWQDWTGGPVRRAVSTYLEPTTLAAALMCGVCLAAAASRAREPIVSLKIVLLIACGILTLSKSFGLFLIILVLYISWGIPSPRRLLSLTVAGCAIALAAQSLDLTEGMFAHVGGLATAINHVVKGNLLGDGLGNAGNYAAEGSDLGIGAESGLGNLLAQVGIVALLYVIWIQQLATDVLKSARKRQDRSGVFFAAMVLGWYVSFLFSASSLGIGGNALTFMAVSLYLHKNYVGRR